jgi:methylthioribose-1-phosphate isomerase
MSIVKFINEYADEALSLAGALNVMLEGVALSPTQSAKVKETIERLEKAHANISKSKPTLVKIQKADIDAAVKAAMPDFNKMVTVAVTKAMKGAK